MFKRSRPRTEREVRIEECMVIQTVHEHTHDLDEDAARRILRSNLRRVKGSDLGESAAVDVLRALRRGENVSMNIETGMLTQ